jgi:hypothetical protein
MIILEFILSKYKYVTTNGKLYTLAHHFMVLVLVLAHLVDARCPYFRRCTNSAVITLICELQFAMTNNAAPRTFPR